MVDTSIMGNEYRVKSAYYGGYPAAYLRRIRALFPDMRRVPHIFSGKIDLAALAGDTVDSDPRPMPTHIDDAQKLLSVRLHAYDLVLANLADRD